jgi:hypothetical protein
MWLVRNVITMRQKNISEPNKIYIMRKDLRKLFAKKMKRKERRILIFLLAKLGFKDLPVTDKVTKARRIVGLMNGNPNFPLPNPSLFTVSAAINALDDAQKALDGSKPKTSIRNEALKQLEKLMTALQSYVDTTAMGNSSIILSAGFEVRDERTKPGVLDAPLGITASHTQMEGQVKLKWKSIKKKNFYRVEAALDGETLVWKIVAESTKATVLINGLQPGMKYCFRIVVVNSAGASAPSGVVLCRPIQY